MSMSALTVAEMDVTCANCGHSVDAHEPFVYHDGPGVYCVARIGGNDGQNGMGEFPSCCECDAFDSLSNAGERQWEHGQRELANG
jgi:hypothetical protein